MRANGRGLGLMACFVALIVMSAVGVAQSAQGTTTAVADDVPTAKLIQPQELEALLRSPGKDKPLVLQVGSHVLYAEAHIVGSEYAGPGGSDAGVKTLRERVNGLKRDRLLVLYCGCCPWNKCPNIRPAYRAVRDLGFTDVKVLYLADNFGTDWVNKGYPIAKGR